MSKSILPTTTRFWMNMHGLLRASQKTGEDVNLSWGLTVKDMDNHWVALYQLSAGSIPEDPGAIPLRLDWRIKDPRDFVTLSHPHPADGFAGKAQLILYQPSEGALWDAMEERGIAVNETQLVGLKLLTPGFKDEWWIRLYVPLTKRLEISNPLPVELKLVTTM